mmetsp:Transcript_23557/g.81580  ORF Transcript_23557/g.81580 Transcript_23557/m.81580 type:complete len:213 (-) Transcript_23557:106-744(-)
MRYLVTRRSSMYSDSSVANGARPSMRRFLALRCARECSGSRCHGDKASVPSAVLWYRSRNASTAATSSSDTACQCDCPCWLPAPFKRRSSGRNVPRGKFGLLVVRSFRRSCCARKCSPMRSSNTGRKTLWRHHRSSASLLGPPRRSRARALCREPPNASARVPPRERARGDADGAANAPMREPPRVPPRACTRGAAELASKSGAEILPTARL